MTRPRTLLCGLLVLGALFPGGALAAPTLESDVVVLQDTVTDPAAVANEHAAKFGFQVGRVYKNALKGYSAAIPTTVVSSLRSDPRVHFLSADRTVGVTAQTLPTGINRVEGDLSSTLSGNGSGSVSTPIAIIDTGSTHADLNVAGGVSCVSGSTSYADGHGHGTHVAGIAAAKDDGAGVVGMAPGAPVWSVRVLGNSGTGPLSAVICGIDWVTANAAAKGIKLANLSIATGGADDNNCGNSNGDALHKAICGSVAKGITYVAGAGNAGQDLAGTVPATYNELLTATGVADFNGKPGGGTTKGCISDVDDSNYDASNYATAGGLDAAHTIAAPGVCIYSLTKGGKYATFTGTSQAAPHVTGAAALCIHSTRCAGLTPSGIISKLRTDAAARPSSFSFTGSPFSPNGTRYYGHLLYAAGY